jgi:hypothetical protein
MLQRRGQLSGIKNLIDQIPDSEIEPIADLLNSSFIERPDRMFVLKELFDHRENVESENSGLAHAAWLLEDAETNQALLNFASKVDWESIVDVKFDLKQSDVSNALVAARRWYESQVHIDTLTKTSLKLSSKESIQFLGSLTRNDQSKDLEKVYDIVLNMQAPRLILNALQLKQENAVPNSMNVQKINQLAHLMNTMAAPAFFSGLRDSLKAYASIDISCFDGAAHIQDPVRWLLGQLPKLQNTKQHRLLLFTAKPFCQTPTRCAKDLDMLDTLISNPGYEMVQGPLYPLIKSDQVLDLVQTDLAGKMVNMMKNATVKDAAILLSNLTLLDQSTDIPKIESYLKRLPAKTAAKLLLAMKDVTDEDWKSLFAVLDRVHSNENQYGTKTARLAYDSWFDTDEHPLYEMGKDWLDALIDNKAIRDSILSALKKPEAAGALKNISELIKTGTLEDVLTQVNKLLEQRINEGAESGKITFKVAAFKNRPRAGWSILKQNLPALANKAVDSCADLDLSWDWHIETKDSPKFDALRRCLKTVPDSLAAGDEWNRTFIGRVLTLIPGIQLLDGPFAKIDLKGMLSAVRMNLKHLGSQKQILFSAQESFTPLYTDIKDLPEFGNIQQELANIAQGKELYELGAELLKPRNIQPIQIPKRDLNDFINERMVGTDFIPDPEGPDSKKLKSNLPFLVGLAKMFEAQCPTLRATDKDCYVHPDQVALYKSPDGPNKLARKIITDYWNSSSSWMPVERKFNTAMNQTSPNIGMVHYHVNPILHMIQNKPDVLESATKALTVPSPTKFADFIQSRGNRLIVIPTYDFDADYPTNGSPDQLFWSKMRFRLVTDLDRLELVAINAGFIPVPGGLKLAGMHLPDWMIPKDIEKLKANAGLELIRDVGLAWGDVPQGQWPANLKALAGASAVCTDSMIRNGQRCIRNLKQANQYVKDTLAGMDKQTKGVMGWFAGAALKKQIRIEDARARIFNLKSLLQFLDDEVPVSAGGKGGMEILRNVFYTIYASSPANLRDDFSSGMSLPVQCLAKPRANPTAACQFDSMDMLIRITRLGLFHQLGLNAVQRNQNQAALLNMVDAAIVNNDQSKKLFTWISSNEGLNVAYILFYKFLSWEGSASPADKEMMLRSFTTLAVNFDLFSPEGKRQIITLLSNSSLNGLAKLLKKTDVLFKLLTKDVSLKMLTLTRPEIQKLEGVLRQISGGAVDSSYVLLDKATDQPENLFSLLNAVDDISVAPASKPILQSIVAKMATDNQALARQKVSEFIRTGGIRNFCDTFTDKTFFEGTLNFLDRAATTGNLDGFLDEVDSAMSTSP